MNELDKRIEHLDQKLKMLRGVSLCMGIALTSFILFGLNAKGPDFLALKKLTIVDEQNRPRIVFSSVIEDGVSQACIVHFDEQGRRKLWQGTEQDIISTTYYDNDQQMRLAHGVDGDREATWISFFKDNVSHSELSWTYGDEADFPSLILPHGYIAGASKVLLFDEESTLRIAIDADDLGGSAMHFIDDDKAPRLTLGLNEDDESGITLFSEGYINRWEAFCEDDAVIMKMSDLNESARLYSVILNDGSAYSSVNDEQEDFDILMGSVEGRVIFDVYEDEEAMNKTEETIEHIVEK